jgi:cobalamin biosynthetic protein CobC
MNSRWVIPEKAEELSHHGGNINAARHLFPDAPRPWIDLSTGINATPYKVDVVTASAWSKLPEPSEFAELEQAARCAYGVEHAAGIVAAPGTQALIQWLPRLFPARRVAVLDVTYAEHETCWRAAGAEVTVVTTLADLIGFDVGIVVNPNNPDGRIFPPHDLAMIAETLARGGGRLIVDEAFVDGLERQDSLMSRMPTSGAVVLRSFGKIYGLAGLRLGFAVSSPEICTCLRTALGPWAVSGPAIEIGRKALADVGWLATTVGRLRDEADRLDRLLRSAGFAIVGGTPLFRLAQHQHAAAWFVQLCRAGILTRPFRARADWLRFGIPGGPSEWERLETVLRSGKDMMSAET